MQWISGNKGAQPHSSEVALVLNTTAIQRRNNPSLLSATATEPTTLQHDVYGSGPTVRRKWPRLDVSTQGVNVRRESVAFGLLSEQLFVPFCGWWRKAVVSRGHVSWGDAASCNLKRGLELRRQLRVGKRHALMVDTTC